MDSSNKILKICKIDNLAFGKFAIISGVDYLGVHILEEKDIGKRLELTNKLSSLGGKIIIVTKIKEFELLKKIILLYHPTGIQLHYKPLLNLLKNLKKEQADIELFSVITEDIDPLFIEQISNLSDKIIYDSSYMGGTGKSHNLDLIKKISLETKNKVLIAGGVNSDFIKKHKASAIAGFDIQSYFRSEGRLLYNKVEEVSRLTKHTKHLKLSVSITNRESINSDNISEEYVTNAHFNYHLDYSDGSLYPDFITNWEETIDKVSAMVGLPLSIHVFSRDEKMINKLIIEITKINGNSISSFFIQYYPGIDLNKINNENNLVISIYYRDLEDYFNKWHNFSDYLSIILPSENIDNFHTASNYLKNNSQWLAKKEVWLDREINQDKIRYLKNTLHFTFNVVVGKAITKSKNSIKEIYEQLSV